MHIGIWFFASEDFPHNNTKGKYINLYQKQTQHLKCYFSIYIYTTEADMGIIASQVNEYRKIKDHHMWMANFMNHFGTIMGVWF